MRASGCEQEASKCCRAWHEVRDVFVWLEGIGLFVSARLQVGMSHGGGGACLGVWVCARLCVCVCVCTAVSVLQAEALRSKHAMTIKARFPPLFLVGVFSFSSRCSLLVAADIHQISHTVEALLDHDWEFAFISLSLSFFSPSIIVCLSLPLCMLQAWGVNALFSLFTYFGRLSRSALYLFFFFFQTGKTRVSKTWSPNRFSVLICSCVGCNDENGNRWL